MKSINKATKAKQPTPTLNPLRRPTAFGSHPTHANVPSPGPEASADGPKPPSQLPQEACVFQGFLHAWFADTKKRRRLPGDLQIALLMEILWDTRNVGGSAGETGIFVRWPCAKWATFGRPEEIEAALKDLAHEGLMNLYRCWEKGAAQTNKAQILAIEPFWLNEGKNSRNSTPLPLLGNECFVLSNRSRYALTKRAMGRMCSLAVRQMGSQWWSLPSMPRPNQWHGLISFKGLARQCGR